MGIELGTNQAGSRDSRRIQEKVGRQVRVGHHSKYQLGDLAPSCVPSPGLGTSVTSAELFCTLLLFLFNQNL